MFTFWKKKKKKSNIDIELLHKLAKENDKDAQFELALAYHRGLNVKKDIDKANYWLDKANE